jgi:hypothetical protein
MDSYEKAAAEHKPIDHVRVRYGRIRPDDLVWSPFTEEFIRFEEMSDVPQRAEYCQDTCYVIRLGKAPAPKPQVKENPPEDLEREVLIHPQQADLFSSW